MTFLEDNRSSGELCQFDDLSDLGDRAALTRLVTLMSDTVFRLAPPESQYLQTAQKLMNMYGATNPVVVPHLVVTLRSPDAYEAGYIKRFAEWFMLSCSVTSLKWLSTF